MKKNFGILILLSGSALGLWGCGWAQDPLTGKEDAIRKAGPPAPNREKPRGVDSNILVVDGATSSTFLEGQPGTLDFKVRSISEDYKISDVVIENASMFPGAIFNKATGRFSWTPPAGTVQNGLQKNAALQIRAYGRHVKDNNNIVSRGLEVLLIVQKNPSDPQIVRTQIPANGPIREGDYFFFTVVVKDVDAGVGSGQGPSVEFLPATNGDISLSSFVSLDTVSPDPASLTWTFRFRLNLNNQEITKSSAMAGFSFQAISQYGRKSAVQSWRTKVFTKLDEIKTGWVAAKNIYFNQNNSIQFLVADVKGEAVISLTKQEGLPTGSALSCMTQAVGMMACEFQWRPTGDPKSMPASGYLTLSFTGRNSDSSDTQVLSRSFVLPYVLVPAPPPTTSKNKGSHP